MKRDFFDDEAVLIRQYECITWTRMKRMKKKQNLPRMLRAALNKFWKQYPNKTAAVQPLTFHLKNHPTKTNTTCWPCWRCLDELKSDVILWTPTQERAREGRPARIFIYQISADNGYCLRTYQERWTIGTVRDDDDDILITFQIMFNWK